METTGHLVLGGLVPGGVPTQVGPFYPGRGREHPGACIAMCEAGHPEWYVPCAGRTGGTRPREGELG